MIKESIQIFLSISMLSDKIIKIIVNERWHILVKEFPLVILDRNIFIGLDKRGYWVNIFLISP